LGAALVLGDERLRGLRSPEFEADARLDIDGAAGLQRIMSIDHARSPYLYIDRAEIVTDQATYLSVVTTPAERRTGRSEETSTAGIVSCLHFKATDGADRPLADLIEGGQVTDQYITVRYGAYLGTANALGLRVNVVEEVRRQQPVVGEV